MSDVKWIKLSVNMFEDEKIKLIESMPGADSILVIWIKLLAQAGKTNASGYIYLNESIPYTDEMLATIFNRPLNTVKLALQTFNNFGMIEITENDFIGIANWEKHQNVDGLNKIREQTKRRVREHRERKKLELLPEPEKKREKKDGKRTCVYCGRPGNSIDHIVPRTKGGDDTKTNIVIACTSCNSSKSNKDLVDFLNDSFFYTHQKVNHELVRKNEQLMSYVAFDEKEKKYVTLRNVTETLRNELGNENETLRNATDIELELEKEKDKNIVEKSTVHIPFIEIIDYLNTKANKNYRVTTKKTKDLITARFKETFTFEDFKKVIDIKTSEWLHTKDEKYLRPETLFGNKFEGYLNQNPKVITGSHKKQNDIDWDNI